MPDAESVEIRRCARCGSAAAVCVQSWGGAISVMGLEAGPTGHTARRDFVCQECGGGFSLDDPSKRRFFGIVGLAVCGPIAFGALTIGTASVLDGEGLPALLVLGAGSVLTAIGVAIARWMDGPARIYRQHPIVAGALLPPLRFAASQPPLRACRCGAGARAIRVTEHEARGISQGTRTDYRCEVCGAEFMIEDARGIALLGVGSAVFVAIGAGLMTTAPGNGAFGWICSGGIALFGALGVLAFVVSLLARARHGVLRQAAPRADER